MNGRSNCKQTKGRPCKVARRGRRGRRGCKQPAGRPCGSKK